MSLYIAGLIYHSSRVQSLTLEKRIKMEGYQVLLI